ncbi:AMP-binding protein [Nocardia otitidiscaviarum]|uniref:AMP-binding protein n=1 Tax=Nocardia otitidiscaviarum TaxID=1823 RepID=UPI001894FD9F|nr:AMP-binding protein [Nocardia otitidiscaviarum]MBF6179468.1 AMP-binding protein [Nocardia otitidiscaviarum]
MTAPLCEVAAAVTRSGILAPVSPPALARLAGAVWRGPNIATLLSVAAARWPHRIALVDERSPLTFATLHHRVRALAGGLHTEYGVGHGDSVLVLCRNGRSFVEAALAAALCGADMVLCNTEFHTEALRRTLAEQRASVLVCDAEFIEKVRAAGYSGLILTGADGDHPRPARGNEPRLSEPEEVGQVGDRSRPAHEKTRSVGGPGGVGRTGSDADASRLGERVDAGRYGECGEVDRGGDRSRPARDDAPSVGSPGSGRTGSDADASRHGEHPDAGRAGVHSDAGRAGEHPDAGRAGERAGVGGSSERSGAGGAGGPVGVEGVGVGESVRSGRDGADPGRVRAGGAERSLEGVIRLGYPAPGRVRPGRIVILTSGTTGAPKGVPRRPSVRSFLGPGLSALYRLGLRSGTTIVVGIPLFHGFGLAVLALGLLLGGTLVLRRGFDPEAALAATAARRADAWAVVPVMLRRVLDLPTEVRERYDTSSLAAVLCGAAPLTPALAHRFMDDFGEVLCNGYGSSEIGIAALATPAELRAAPGTVGRPVAGTAVAVLDTAGRPVPAGRTGRICVGGAQGFSGYSSGHDKQRVAGLIDSGDLGRFDAAGRLFVVGRSDDMIVSGGENVYPQVVENVLAAHPDVSDVAVMGVDDEEYGQRLVAYVVAATGSSPSVTRLREYLYPNVSRFERPRDIMITGEIPRNAAGKIDRAALRQQYGG